MRRLLGIALALLATAAVASPAPQSLPKAVWIIRDRIQEPGGARTAVEAARRHGFDTLVVQVRGRGDAYYRSELAPAAEAVLAGFDPLAEVLAGASGGRVLAWTNVFYVWEKERPPEASSHVVRAHPDWLLRDAGGRPLVEYSVVERALTGIEGAYADPASPEYRAHFCDLIRELVSRYPVDGVHLDYVRYPGAGHGDVGPLAEAFKAKWGVDPALIPEELRRPDLPSWLRGEGSAADRVLGTAALLWAETRAGEVTSLVRAVRQTLDSVRPGLELSAAVFPNVPGAYLNQGQDWASWAEEGLVQALFPMAYSGNTERVASQLLAMRDLIRPRNPSVRLWAGLGGFLKPPEKIRAEAAAARDLGYDGLCLFDLGAVLAKPNGLPPYADALRVGERKEVPVVGATSSAPLREPNPSAMLASAVRKALGSAPVEGLDLSAAVAERWAEFEEARRGALPRVVAQMPAAPVAAGSWAEATAIVRYAGGKDGEPLREAHRSALTSARDRLVAGAAFETVVQEVAEGGKRGAGGTLARRYLRQESPVDRTLAALEPGQVSPVIDAPGGLWLFRLERKGTAETGPWKDAPASARRAHFRSELAKALGSEAESAGGASPRAGTTP